MSTFSHQAHAGLDYARWTDPLAVMVLTSGRLASFIPPKEGVYGRIFFDESLNNFSGICNNPGKYEWNDVRIEADLGAYFVPSVKNSGYYRLTDEVDVKVQVYAPDWYPYPMTFEDGRYKANGRGPIKPGLGRVHDVFSTAGYNLTDFIITKDIVGGAIFVPPNIEVATIYTIGYIRSPYPPRPEKPLLKIVIGPHGIIIPVPIVCDINNGTDINVEFDRIAVSSVSESVSNTANYKDVPLEVKCSSALNQEVNLRLVAGTTSFSDELIATNYPDLGIAVKHKGQLLKPMGTSAVRLINGMASEVITVLPVKKKGQPLSGGEFNASATLLISLP
ncbi:fimbrial protein [Pantoea dispersa]|uniref:fimbrial protein n=1 Tax=Pantoea dispersa TaxID=59814 RepID=UPI0021F6CB82|nr:fimbrial protein [Pantoea dispersa]UYP73320.1 fimbrial protein [Pantoea dispersa]